MNNEEKLFILEGKLVFYAKDLDDAFEKLSEYFKALAEGKEPTLEGFSGTEIKLRPLTEKESLERIKLVCEACDSGLIDSKEWETQIREYLRNLETPEAWEEFKKIIEKSALRELRRIQREGARFIEENKEWIEEKIRKLEKGQK